jgi:hypothetical protein
MVKVMPAVPAWHVGNMTEPVAQTCETQIEGAWRSITVAEAKSTYVMAPKLYAPQGAYRLPPGSEAVLRHALTASAGAHLIHSSGQLVVAL